MVWFLDSEPDGLVGSIHFNSLDLLITFDPWRSGQVMSFALCTSVSFWRFISGSLHYHCYPLFKPHTVFVGVPPLGSSSALTVAQRRCGSWWPRWWTPRSLWSGPCFCWVWSSIFLALGQIVLESAPTISDRFCSVSWVSWCVTTGQKIIVWDQSDGPL